MHLLSTRPGGFVEDDSIITRLDQTPADMVVLSSADTTLSLLADAYRMWQQAESHASEPVPTLRLANLLHLRQSASMDLYVDEVLQHAKLIIVDHLGAESTWPYGIEQLRKLALQRGIQLAMFSGDSQEDAELLAKGTLALEHSRALWQYLRAGGLGNAREFLRMGAAWGLGRATQGTPVRVLPPVAVHVPMAWVSDARLHAGHIPGLDDLQARWLPGAPVVMLVFYRSHLLAANTDAFDAMAEALLAHGMNPLPLALESLKDTLCLQTLRTLCDTHGVQLILNTTAFAALGEHARAGSNTDTLAGDIPVLQVIASGTNREDWLEDSQGLRPRDIAMQVVLPEMDGRIMTRAMSFKGLAHRCDLTQTDVVAYQAEPDRVQWVAELAQRWCALRSKPAAQKRAALILANYPGSEARMGSGVGLDTPESVIALLAQLERDGWQLGDAAQRPNSGLALMERLQQGIANDPQQWPLRPAQQGYALHSYQQRLAQLPAGMADAISAQWGPPEQDPMLRDGWFMVAGLQLGHVFVGIQPARALDGRNDYAQYHDAELVPPHHYLAFYFWLRDNFGADAIVHVGKHGNLEWLPGKSLALSQQCWPDAILGPMPHIYPFIVNDPGEGAQAKRRSQAVIIDHLMPPLTRAENHGPMQELERLVDEFYEALLVDLRRADMLRRQILEAARGQDLLRELGLESTEAQPQEDQILERIDAYLCELKETQIRDGLHIFGSSPSGGLRDSTLLALARYPAAGELGLLNALAADLLPGCEWNPLDMDAAAPWAGPRPAVLQALEAGQWRHGGDTRERLELLALQVLTQLELAADWPHTQRVLARIHTQIAPSLDACGSQELLQFSRALQGKFVPPGPSGSPSRGRCDTLPTGRNFYTVDTRAIPTQTAWVLGQQSCDRLIARYLQEHGEYPTAIGISVWGTATMRTGGDDIAQAFALIGVRPKWAPGSQRVVDFEVIPRVGLHRPRVDVTLRISGFFRDAFPGVIQMFDAAVRAVAEQDEDAEDNPIRARVLHDAAQWSTQGLPADQAHEQALWRVFGAPAGSYGASMHELLRTGQWTDAGDFARHYLHWGAYAYGQHAEGTPARQALEQRMQTLDVVLQNQDSREHDLLDSSEYYQHQGGMVAAVRHLGGEAPAVYHGDHGNPQSAKIRSLAEEIGRVVRARVTNPKWMDGAMRHGYKGAFEMAATVDYLFGFDATTQLVSDTHYALVTEAYVQNDKVRDFLRTHNPQAFSDIVNRLLEAIDRGMWEQPGALHGALQAHMLAQEAWMEGRTQP